MKFLFTGLRRDMLLALGSFFNSSTRGGMFINSCFAHCQSETQNTWFGVDSPRIHNKVQNKFHNIYIEIYIWLTLFISTVLLLMNCIFCFGLEIESSCEVLLRLICSLYGCVLTRPLQKQLVIGTLAGG